MKDRLNLSSNFLSKLSKKFGNAYYLFDKSLFENNLSAFKSAFSHHYSNVELGYSYKTNYIPQICKIAKEKGAYAEVVSGLEYDLALKIGSGGRDIIFNGPLKEQSELRKAFDNDSIVHFDSYREIDVLKDYLKNNPTKSIRCALRCNFNIGENQRSRFGFDATSGEVEKVYEELFSLEGCNPVGIHCHFSTRHRSVESYEKRTSLIIELAKKIFQENTIEYIDVGGGFFGEMPSSIKELFDYDIPTYNDYGKAVGKLMSKHFPKQDVTLILEPGASVVANTMKFICQVFSIKKINDRPIITLTGGVHNVRPTGSGSDIPFRVFSNSIERSELKNGLIGGYTCMETDIISNSFNGELGVGDFVVFDNMGAYNLVFKPPFIKETPPVLQISLNGNSIKVLKNKEKLEDIFSTYLF